MGVYTRFKRDPDGFRKLVELLETTPKVRRQKMIDVGMKEDPDYTQQALKYMMTFEDLLNMPETELAEVLNHAAAKMIGYAIAKADKETQDRFIRCTPQKKMGEVRDTLEFEVGLSEIGGAQLKLLSSAREMEKAGFVKTKKIPYRLDPDDII